MTSSSDGSFLPGQHDAAALSPLHAVLQRPMADFTVEELRKMYGPLTRAVLARPKISAIDMPESTTYFPVYASLLQLSDALRGWCREQQMTRLQCQAHRAGAMTDNAWRATLEQGWEILATAKACPAKWVQEAATRMETVVLHALDEVHTSQAERLRPAERFQQPLTTLSARHVYTIERRLHLEWLGLGEHLSGQEVERAAGAYPDLTKLAEALMSASDAVETEYKKSGKAGDADDPTEIERRADVCYQNFLNDSPEQRSALEEGWTIIARAK
jgi:hypothetical protein